MQRSRGAGNIDGYHRSIPHLAQVWRHCRVAIHLCPVSKELTCDRQALYPPRLAHNGLPQFVTTIEGMDIHFIHVRSGYTAMSHEGATGAPASFEPWGRELIVAIAQKTDEISVPVAVTVFPGEVCRAAESWARRAHPKLAYYRVAERGGHLRLGSTRSCSPPSYCR